MVEKRKFIRHDSLHLLDYLVVDQSGNPGTYSMGRTLDVSADGLQLEITNPLAPSNILSVTVGLEDELVDISATVTHCRSNKGRFVAGISFNKISKEHRRILNLYIDAFNKNRNTATP